LAKAYFVWRIYEDKIEIAPAGEILKNLIPLLLGKIAKQSHS